MSRAMNLALPQAEVESACASAKVAISAIEVLPSGGTHLVCLNITGADEMRHRLKKHLIAGRVKRYPFLIANKY